MQLKTFCRINPWPRNRPVWLQPANSLHSNIVAFWSHGLFCRRSLENLNRQQRYDMINHNKR